VLNETPLLQGLTPSQQAVVGLREGKGGQKGERLPATPTVTATDRNPIVILIVRLLAVSSMAGDRIALTNGASPQDDVGALLGPIGLQLVRRDRKWDKKTAAHRASALALTFPRSEPEAEPLLLKRKLQLEENNASRVQRLKARFNGLAG
jgi:hypothetical protein